MTELEKKRRGLPPVAMAACIVLGVGLLAVILIVAPLPVVQAAGPVVNTLVDDNGSGACDESHCSLREAIKDAGAGQEITFDVTGTITLTYGDLVVDKLGPLTITGPGPGAVTVDGNDTSRVFRVVTSTLRIQNLIISGGRAPLDLSSNGLGGGILVGSDAALELDQVKVTDNQAIGGARPGADGAGRGGGIYSSGPLTITDSTISGNIAQGADGDQPGWAVGGGIMAQWRTTINGSTIADNRAIGGRAIVLAAAVNGSVDGLSTGGLAYGGGIYANTTIVVSATTVLSNSAQGGSGEQGGPAYGGGLAIDSNTLTLEASTFASNTVMAGNSQIPVAAYGGGIYLNLGNLLITNSTFSANRGLVGASQSAQGGALWVSTGVQGWVRISSSSFVANTAQGTGTGSAIQLGDAALTISNTLFAANDPGYDCFGAGTMAGSNNLSGESCPGSLGPPTGVDLALKDNGGPTWTHALLPGSNALNQDAACKDVLGNALTKDQRLTLRPKGPACDIGAFEAEASVELEMNKEAEPDADVAYHGAVTYTLVISNNGTLDALDTEVEDRLPDEVTFGGWISQPVGAAVSDDVVSWTGALSSGGQVSFAFWVTHTGGYGDVVSNTATYSQASDTGSAEAVFTVVDPSLALIKRATPDTDVASGGLVTYTLILDNRGNVDAEGAELADPLPDEVSFAGWLAKPPGASLSGDVVTWNGSVTEGEAITLTFAVTFTGEAGSVVTNTATYTHASGTGQGSAVFEAIPAAPGNYYVFLPMMLKSK